MESVEVTKEAVTGMSAPTFYYAEVRPKAPKIRYVVDIRSLSICSHYCRRQVRKTEKTRRI